MAIKRERVSMGVSNIAAVNQNSTGNQDNTGTRVTPRLNQNPAVSGRGERGERVSARGEGGGDRVSAMTTSRGGESARDRSDQPQTSARNSSDRNNQPQYSARSARSTMNATFPSIGYTGDSTSSSRFHTPMSGRQQNNRNTLSHSLRTTLLDPETALFPISKTRSELMKRISSIESRVHISFDLDNDGFVGQEDYRLAKALDTRGNGFLSAEEMIKGQRILADTFFKKHGHSLEKFGGNYKNNTHEENVDYLVNGNFKLLYRKLKERERSVMATASEPVMSCMQLEDDTLIKHNFYADKFDCTAWNDFDAIPRAASSYGPNDHGGSRKRLLFSRQQVVRESNQARLDKAVSDQPKYNYCRSNLITNVAAENS